VGGQIKKDKKKHSIDYVVCAQNIKYFKYLNKKYRYTPLRRESKRGGGRRD